MDLGTELEKLEGELKGAITKWEHEKDRKQVLDAKQKEKDEKAALTKYNRVLKQLEKTDNEWVKTRVASITAPPWDWSLQHLLLVIEELEDLFVRQSC